MTGGAWGGVRARRLAGVVLLLLAATTLWVLAHRAPQPNPPIVHLTLVLPDGWKAQDPLITAWQDAAAELGFELQLVGASELLRDDDDHVDAALILPDSVHRRMNDALLSHVVRRVERGAKLMLVHDAGITDLNGLYHPTQSRLSALAGVRHALYAKLREGMVQAQTVHVDSPALPALRLPPGKLMRNGSQPYNSAQTAPLADEDLMIVGYHYGKLRYPVLVTEGEYKGRRLMHAGDGSLVAGVNTVGRGQVLFVNLPLAQLKLRTDGMFLHSFLRLFAQDLAQLPQLSPMPDARGALVMNWHIDNGAAVPAMQKLAELGAFNQGPYSVHLTAGPDVNTPGDGLGMDLSNNPVMKAWVQRFAQRGDEVGSHGGWIHNEFGRLIGTQAPEKSTELIERNTASVSGASGQPVREYSAPTGNHPAWVTPWLHDRGVRAYYFTGDVGMPPTRAYQDGVRGPADMWAFPVLSYGRFAAFEEAYMNQVPEEDVGAWLLDVADYCALSRSMRLVYFHPPGVALFPKAFKQWLDHTQQLIDDGRLRWMTMAQFADFSNRRLKVGWQLQPKAGHMVLTVDSPDTLQSLAWLLPAQRFARPTVTEGQARIERDGAYWRVTAADGRRLRLELPSAPQPVDQVNTQSAPPPAAPPAPLPAAGAALPPGAATPASRSAPPVPNPRSTAPAAT